MLDEKTILVTGGTGSFGQKFVETVLKRYRPRKIIIYSRDEYKQYQMLQKFSKFEKILRFFIGDIRDRQRLCRALEGVDYVIHAAAFKQVPAAEYNPFEAVKTNILGTQNLVEAAIDKGVKKVVALSTDKAVNPINLYGATKLAMEKIVLAGENYSGQKDISFCVVRYGNVLGSRGSVLPYFLDLKRKGCKVFPITDSRMTRFWITLDEAVNLVLFALENAVGGEIFVPKIPSMKIVDLARALSPECEFKFIGIRPGEKLHETLISEDESRTVHDIGAYYVILPQFLFRGKRVHEVYASYPKVTEGFSYRSDTNDWWLSVEDLRSILVAHYGEEVCSPTVVNLLTMKTSLAS